MTEARSVNLALEYGTDLSSRRRAATLRREITGQTVVNFADVRTISDSFADELFAVLVAERGEDWFKANVRVVNLPAHIRETILRAIQSRRERRSSLPVR